MLAIQKTNRVHPLFNTLRSGWNIVSQSSLTMASAFLLSLLLLVICSHGGIAQANEAAAGHKESRYVVVPKAAFQSSEESCSTSRGIIRSTVIPMTNKAGRILDEY